MFVVEYVDHLVSELGMPSNLAILALRRTNDLSGLTVHTPRTRLEINSSGWYRQCTIVHLSEYIELCRLLGKCKTTISKPILKYSLFFVRSDANKLVSLSWFVTQMGGGEG